MNVRDKVGWMDKDFDSIISGIEIQEPTDLNYSELSSDTLLDIYVDVSEQLRQLEQQLRPVTQEGRDLHSQRAAVKIILANRGILA